MLGESDQAVECGQDQVGTWLEIHAGRGREAELLDVRKALGERAHKFVVYADYAVNLDSNGTQESESS